MQDRIFAIGDIHGCAAELELLIRQLPLCTDSTLVFLGDYIDRGIESRRVIQIILELKKKYQVIALRGNHEQMFLDFLQHPESAGAALFVMNGGSSTLANYATAAGSFEIPEDHLVFLQNLEMFYQTEKYYFVHAGLPEIPLKEVSPRTHHMQMLWMRFPFLRSSYDWGKIIVHGHTPVAEVEIKRNRINIDTACVYDGCLTAIGLPSHKIYSVEKEIKQQKPVLLKDKSSRVTVRFQGAVKVIVSISGVKLEFETINYNQFGLLLRNVGDSTTEFLKVGDFIDGQMGQDLESSIQFTGEVVRTESRQDIVLYGVKITQLQSG